MLKIRLRRTGAKKQPRYRVVVAESSAPRDGAFVEVLGWYNPQADPAQVVIDTEKADQWIARGAQPSDRVAYLLTRARAGDTGLNVTSRSTPTAEPPAATVAGATAAATTAGSIEVASDSADERAQDSASAPESEGSADTVTTASTEPASTDEPQTEGSAGATPV